MSGMQVVLEIGLAGLLVATLFYAVRLERALGVLRRGSGSMEPLVESFDASTRQAEAATARLRESVEGAGRQIGRQTDTAMTLKDDLAFLVERGDRLADRIDALVRKARPLATEAPRLVSDRQIHERVAPERPAGERSGGERHASERPAGDRLAGERPAGERLAAERLAGERLAGERVASERLGAERPAGERPGAERAGAERTRVRSQAERDLLKALRMAR